MSAKRLSIRALALRGSAWALFLHGGMQVIRFARSLILTRLLFPEAFGMMAIVWTLMYGLEMLSDTGIGPAIVRDRNGKQPEFLNTAWTIQVIRGAVLWVIAGLLAYPMANFYGEPQLAWLIPVAGLSALVSGFISTSVHTCRRDMDFGRQSMIELGSEVFALGVTVAWALHDPTVWVLVAGALTGRLLFCIASHFLLPGIRNGFHWHRESVRSIFDFGRWIFLSSMLYFVGAQGDRLLLGRVVGMTQLGVYSIAVTISEAVNALVLKLNHGVLYPAYAQVLREDAQRLRGVYYRTRLTMDAFVLAPIAALMMLGEQVVALLYDIRYHEAGWMLQLLCIRLIMVAALSNSEACLIAIGKPQYSVVQNACRAAWILFGIPLGWHLMGIKGVVLAVALSEMPTLVVLWWGLARERMLSPVLELRSVLFVGVGAAGGHLVARLGA